MSFKSQNTDVRTYKGSTELRGSDIIEQIIYTISYETVQGKYLFLPCPVLKISFKRFMKLNSRMAKSK